MVLMTGVALNEQGVALNEQGVELNEQGVGQVADGQRPYIVPLATSHTYSFPFHW